MGIRHSSLQRFACLLLDRTPGLHGELGATGCPIFFECAMHWTIDDELRFADEIPSETETCETET